MSLFLGICGGRWATMHLLSRIIDSRFETLTEVNVRIERARGTLAETLPARTPARPAFTMDDRPFLKLSGE